MKIADFNVQIFEFYLRLEAFGTAVCGLFISTYPPPGFGGRNMACVFAKMV